MTDNRLSGLALIAASCGSIITMALHPTGHIPAEQLERTIRMMIIVHSFAMAWVPVQFLGGLGLSRRIDRNGRFGIAGLVLYGFGLVAITSAAVADGLVIPDVFRQIVASAGSQAAIDNWRMLSRYTFYWNQGYAQVFVGASSMAIFLWSVGIWRSGNFARGLAIYGCILPLVTVGAMFSGHLPLDAHRFGIVVLGQAIWFVVAGAQLWNAEGPTVAVS
ncbi:MAG: hypothetical protein WBS19_11230 [Candidatus Korobacteraceae bacterium]